MENKLKQDHYKVKATEQQEKTQYKTGRGAQINTKNRFLKNETTKEHIEAIDDWEETALQTQYIETHPKTIVWETLCYPGKFSTDRDARVQDHPPAEAHRHGIPPHQN